MLPGRIFNLAHKASSIIMLVRQATMHEHEKRRKRFINELIALLKAYMERYDLTQRQLSKKIDVDETTISKWFGKNTKQVSFENLEKASEFIAKEFGKPYGKHYLLHRYGMRLAHGDAASADLTSIEETECKVPVLDHPNGEAQNYALYPKDLVRQGDAQMLYVLCLDKVKWKCVDVQNARFVLVDRIEKPQTGDRVVVTIDDEVGVYFFAEYGKTRVLQLAVGEKPIVFNGNQKIHGVVVATFYRKVKVT